MKEIVGQDSHVEVEDTDVQGVDPIKILWKLSNHSNRNRIEIKEDDGIGVERPLDGVVPSQVEASVSNPYPTPVHILGIDVVQPADDRAWLLSPPHSVSST